jgi:hypothetical protein
MPVAHLPLASASVTEIALAAPASVSVATTQRPTVTSARVSVTSLVSAVAAVKRTAVWDEPSCTWATPSERYEISPVTPDGVSAAPPVPLPVPPLPALALAEAEAFTDGVPEEQPASRTAPQAAAKMDVRKVVMVSRFFLFNMSFTGP